jgi:hypothetical protein
MIHRYLDIVFIVDAWGHMDVNERPSIAVFIVTNFFPFLLSEGENLVGESVFLNRSDLEEPASEQKKQNQLQLTLVKVSPQWKLSSLNSQAQTRVRVTRFERSDEATAHSFVSWNGSISQDLEIVLVKR